MGESGLETNLAEKYKQIKQIYFGEINLKVQKITASVLGPLLVVVVGLMYYFFREWQMLTIFGAMVVLEFVFFASYLLMVKGRLSQAISLNGLAVFFVVTVLTCLVGDIIALGIIANISVAIRGAVYSRRELFIGIIATFVSFVLSLYISRYYPQIQMKLKDTHWLLTNVSGVLMSLTLVGYSIWDLSKLNLKLFNDSEQRNTKMSDVLVTIGEISPGIFSSVGQVRALSDVFTERVTEQVTASSEVGATVSEVMQIASQTARTAAETQSLAETSREELFQNSEKLRKVERGFEEAVATIEDARSEISDLATQFERIEEILDNNMEIGEHIKVLAVNAAIEAAKAGEAGQGFHVVAMELRDMIQNTDNNLDRSRRLIDEIRNRSKDSSDIIRNGAEKLLRYFEDLQDTGNTIEESLESFAIAARQVKKMAYAANEQQSGMREISATMSEIESGTGLLSETVKLLIDEIAKIDSSQKKLEKTLSVT